MIMVTNYWVPNKEGLKSRTCGLWHRVPMW